MDLSLLSTQPELLLLALAPIFLLCMLLEWVWANKWHKLPKTAFYKLSETLCNFALALMHQASDIITGLLISALYVSIFQWRMFDIEMNIISFIGLMIAQDFCYYWFHRCSHRIRFMWAAHVVHHSSENMNFSTAFRQSLMYPIAGMWIFWLPLVIIGFPPNMVVFVVLLNLGLQFFVHTQLVKKLGPIEWLFNTPSHHRVHHGRNPEYIDKNYAGVLIIWDKLFNTFALEQARVDYGITKPVHSFNPITVTFSEWADLATDVFAKNLTVKQRFGILFNPPEKEVD